MTFRTGDEIDSYVIERPLSENGGMSQVFLARHKTKEHIQVAVKVQLTNSEHGRTYQELLRSEAHYLSFLRHPGIVHIYPLTVGNRVSFTARAHQYQGQPWYFAMEHVPGNSLAAHIKEIARFPLEWTVELFYQLLLIVHYLHQTGHAHCDLKPANILLREPPDPRRVPRPVLVDFGSTAEISKGISHLTGSLLYSPPEVILVMERKDILTNDLQLLPDKIDIWALGAILFEIVTGRPLINKKRKDDITTSIIKGELDNIRSLRPEVHQSLDITLENMLKRKATNRPTVGVIIKAIEEKIASVRPPRVG